MFWALKFPTVAVSECGFRGLATKWLQPFPSCSWGKQSLLEGVCYKYGGCGGALLQFTAVVGQTSWGVLPPYTHTATHMSFFFQLTSWSLLVFALCHWTLLGHSVESSKLDLNWGFSLNHTYYLEQSTSLTTAGATPAFISPAANCKLTGKPRSTVAETRKILPHLE